MPGVRLETLRPGDLVPSLHLRPAGDPRPYVEPPAILLVVVRHLLDEVGPRTDQAHLAQEDVDELRQLVEARAAEKPPAAGDTRVVRDDAVRILAQPFGAAALDRVANHRPELEHPEW